MTLKDNVMYEVVGKYETRKEGEVVLAGSNASEDAQGEDGGDEAGSVSGVDIVLNHQLVETGFGDKKGFTAYLKAYMKKVLKYLEENDRAAEIEEFKTNINGVMKELMGSFKDLQFFSGESMSLTSTNYQRRILFMFLSLKGFHSFPQQRFYSFHSRSLLRRQNYLRFFRFQSIWKCL